MLDIHPDKDVLVLSATGEKIGTMKAKQARELARQEGLDLVTISCHSSQTVCKIMDEGKWKYQQAKKQKLQHKKSLPIKEIKFGVATEQHDLDVKTKRIREFIDKGYTVKISVEMRGREKTHAVLAKTKLEDIIKSLGESIRPGDVKVIPSCVFVTVQPARLKHGEGSEVETRSKPCPGNVLDQGETRSA